MIYLTLCIALVCVWGVLRGVAEVLARRAEVRYPPEGAFVTVGGCRLRFLRQGSGPPVVLLHGSDGFLEDFAPVLRAPSADALDLLAFDRPGHGYSDAPEKDGG